SASSNSSSSSRSSGRNLKIQVSNAASLIKAGASLSASLNATISPLTGAWMSDAALTDSTTPAGSPAIKRAPTRTSPTKTRSPSCSWANSVITTSSTPLFSRTHSCVAAYRRSFGDDILCSFDEILRNALQGASARNARGPAPMEGVAAQPAGHVQRFAHYIQSGHLAGLHGPLIDAVGVHATAHDFGLAIPGRTRRVQRPRMN